MAKFAGSIALEVLFLVVAQFEEITMRVEARTCQRASQTWKGVCFRNEKCRNNCLREKARTGNCKYVFRACICYFPC
uniref:Defensin n=1 Tax=Trichosanthes kirilowii TaxID=3677 RepID=Q19JA1_TRIKI|nr:defensin precursor [Trichosanthes kirilowii]